MPSDSEICYYVLHLGRTSGQSAFTGRYWEPLTEWCGRMVDEMWVYYWEEDDSVKKLIEDKGLNPLEVPDSAKFAPLCRSRMILTPEQVYLALHTFRFHIDYGLQILECCSGERLLAYIYTQDDENYAQLYLTRSEAKELCFHLGDLSENLKACAEDASSIDSYAEKGWKPLGSAD